MKKLYLLLIAVFAINFASGQTCNGWNPIFNGETNDLYSTYFLNIDTGYAVGLNGTIIKTVNGGTSWTLLNSGTLTNLKSVCFINADTGYVADANGAIIKTVNGGSTWQTLSLSSSINTIYFVNPQVGFLVGWGGVILKTINGGTSWTTVISGTTNSLFSVSFPNQNTGYIAGSNGTILKTIDGGNNWFSLSSGTTSYLYSVSFTDVDTGYAVGNYATILKTVNGGTTWITQSSGLPPNTGFSSVYFITPNKGYIILGVQILKTTNGGVNWTVQDDSIPFSKVSVFFVNKNIGYIVGNGGLVSKTINGGLSWSLVKREHNLYFVFPNANVGYAGGYMESIKKTIDGGTTWTLLDSLQTNGFYNLFFLNSDTGYASNNHNLIKTTDGGITWTTLLTAQGNHLLGSMYFVNNIGYIASWAVNNDNVGFYKTTNGGITWNLYVGQNSVNLDKIVFTDANTGYAVGEIDPYGKGIIQKTTNGGANWIANACPEYGRISNIFFLDANNGFAIGGDKLVKTTNAFSTWTTISLPYTVFNSVYFISIDTGYIVGDYGLILKTTDGGVTWNTQISGTNGLLSQVLFTNSQNGYICGYNINGLILRTVQGGEPAVLNTKPNGPSQRCKSSSTTTYTTFSNYSNSYYWSLYPANAGVINTTGPTCTVNWDSAFTGTAYIKVYGSNGTCIGKPDSLIVTTVAYTPGNFNLLTPSNNLITNTTPLFTWNTSINSNYYRLFIDGVLKKDNITTNSYQIANNETLSHGLHTWYVTSGGCPIQSNQTSTIYVDAIQPTSFNLTTPYDSTWSNSQYPVLSWNASGDTNSGLKKYQLWIDNVLNRDTIPVTFTSITPLTVLSNGNHNWYIKAFDSIGNVRSSSNINTLKIDRVSPKVCNLMFPAPNKSLSTLYPSFTWSSSSDTGVGFKKYQLYIDSVLVKDNLSDTNYTVLNPLSLGWHKWYVHSLDSLGNIQSSNFNNLAIDNLPPNAFNLTNPGNNIVTNNASPYFSWEFKQDSLNFGLIIKSQLWIDGVIIFDSIPIFYTILNQPLLQGTHYWFVRVFDNAGNYKQSNQTNRYKVDLDNPTAFNLISPANYDTVYTFKPQFKWHSSSDLGTSILKYKLNISGVSPITILSTDTTFTLVNNLTNSTNYTWYVTAYDSVGNTTNSDTNHFIVKVPLPGQAATPTGLTSVCINSSNTTYTTTGALNADSYNWSIWPSSTGTISGNTLNANVVWNNLIYGTIQIKVRGYNNVGYGLYSLPLLVTINPKTIAGTVSGGTNICLGDSTGLLALSGQVGKVIKWQKSFNNSIWTDLSDTNLTYREAPSANGIWTYRAVVQSGVCAILYSDSTIVNVGYNPVASAGAISGATNVCQGQNSVLYTVPTIANATSYIWTLPNGATVTSSSNNITINYENNASSGDIKVRGSNACGVGDSSTLAIIVNPMPVTPVIIQNNNSLNSNATIGNQWYNLTTGIITGATAQTFNPSQIDNYFTIVTLGGCKSDSSNIIYYNNTGIETNDNNATLRIYPNPVTNELTIVMNGNKVKVAFEIFNSIGQSIYKGNLIEKTIVQTSSFAPGVYVIKLNNGKVFEFKKIIKE